MMSEYPAHGPAAADAAPALEWRIDPWREFPARAVTAFLAAVSLGLLAVRTSPVPVAGWALAISLLVMFGPAYLPMRCRVDAAGIGRRLGIGWERRRWEDIRRARLGDQGLYVSTLANGGPLEPFRGLLLPLPRQGGDDLRAALAATMEAHGV